jgi:hypothetical protein
LTRTEAISTFSWSSTRTRRSFLTATLASKSRWEGLYGSKVDLVTVGSLQNPYFIRAVDKTRQLVYAAEDTQAA